MKTRKSVLQVREDDIVIEIRSIDEDKRIIKGVATTSSLARDGDIIETKGIKFKTPLPYLFSHDSRQQLGNVISAEVSNNNIAVEVQMFPAGIAQYVDEKWALIKAGGYRSFSLGWRTLQETFDKTFGGFRITESEWLELSAVAVPADANATVSSVRSADASNPAASGRKDSGIVRLTPSNAPGASGKLRENSMKIREQITSLENKSAASERRMSEIMTKSGDEGRTMDEAETQEYDGLAAEVRQIDEHLVRARAQEARNVANAQRVDTGIVADPAQRAAEPGARRDPIILTSNLPKGIGVARMAIAMVRAQNNPYMAMELAKTHWKDNPEVAMGLRAAVEAGDTTTSGWASQLLPAAQQMSGEFLEMLRDRIIIGRLPLRKVPFNVSVPLQSGAGTYRYVGEGAGKPVTSPTYGNATLRFEKAAGIIVITDELARFGSPDAEVLVRDEMLKGLTNFFDTIFVGATAAVSNVQPAGILNGKSATAASGTTAAFFRANFNTMMQIAITNKQDPSMAYIIMSAGIAMALSSMVNSLGQPDFPTITATGGSYLGVPIIVSQAAGTNIILLFPDQILLAEDPGVRIDVSREATIEMDTTPTAGESSPITTVETIKSMFQNNMVAIRAEQYRTWKVARTSAVEYISGAAYTP